MNYELAKELKDAGFPQKGGLFKGRMYDDAGDFVQPENRQYIPTLEELIEACGNHAKFILSYLRAHKNWRAAIVDETITKGHGENALEAVARLWLAINKK